MWWMSSPGVGWVEETHGTFAFKRAIRSYAICGKIKLLTYLVKDQLETRTVRDLQLHVPRVIKEE